MKETEQNEYGKSIHGQHFALPFVPGSPSESVRDPHRPTLVPGKMSIPHPSTERTPPFKLAECLNLDPLSEVTDPYLRVAVPLWRSNPTGKG